MVGLSEDESKGFASSGSSIQNNLHYQDNKERNLLTILVAISLKPFTELEV